MGNWSVIINFRNRSICSDDAQPEDDQLGGSMFNEVGEPDSEGLPTHTDENGMLWRRHGDGEVDWWDRASSTWKRW